LTTVTCYPCVIWDIKSKSGHRGYNFLNSIIKAFLSHDESRRTGTFVWEDHFKLRRISLISMVWDIASEFGARKKGMLKPKYIMSNGDAKCGVSIRDVTRTLDHGCMLDRIPSLCK
jgi:hypothetical protein